MKSEQRLKCLNDLIEDFGGSSQPSQRDLGTCNLLLEHLEAARRYLLGASVDEYRSSLQQAKDSAFGIANVSTRADVRRALTSLLAYSFV